MIVKKILFLWNFPQQEKQENTLTMSNTTLSAVVREIVRRNAEKKSRDKTEPIPENAKPQSKKKKTPPPKLLLAGIFKSNLAPIPVIPSTPANPAIPVVLAVSAGPAAPARSSTPPTKEKKNFSKYNFPLIKLFLQEFLKMHKGIEVFLGEQMESFFQKLDEKFFLWLNHKNNSGKMMHEIKKEFMIIADALLLFEVMNEQQKQNLSRFIIGPCKFAKQIYSGSNSSILQSEIDNGPFQQILATFANETQKDSFIDFAENSQFDLMDPQPYSKPLLRKPFEATNMSDTLPPIPDLYDTRCHIFNMEMELADISDMVDISDAADMTDISNMETYISSFFND